MNHENYSLEVEDWIREERSLSRERSQSKAFIGDRPYRQFDGRVSLADMESNAAEHLLSELRYPLRLSKHSFYPFIRNDSKVRRFTKSVSIDQSGEIIKKVVIKQKVRPIMYASHRDAVVFGFYGYLLKKVYEVKLEKYQISSSVIAYRKIARNDISKRNKSNIDFANDIYTYISSQANSAVICIDISNFFGTISHVRLRRKWSELLNEDELPVGHNTVFKNITRYRYVFLDEVRVALGLGIIVRGKFEYKSNIQSIMKFGPLTKTSAEFNSKIKNSKLVLYNGSPYGIPQGSPISDILANLYLMEFDRALSKRLTTLSFGMYRRYSDDILIVCPQENVTDIYTYMQELLKLDELNINENKTELFYIDRTARSLVDKTSLLVKDYHKNKSYIQYLGFEFDLDDIHIRSGTIARYYRKMKKRLNVSDKDKEKDGDPSGSRNRKKNAPKRDKYFYIKQASKRIEGTRLLRQFAAVRKRTARIRSNRKKI